MITRRHILRGLVAAPAVVVASSLMPISAKKLVDSQLFVVRDWNCDGLWMTGYDHYGNEMCEFVPMVKVIDHRITGLWPK